MRGGAVDVVVLAPGLAGPDAGGAGDAAQAASLLLEDLEVPGLEELLSRAVSLEGAVRASTLPAMAFEALGGRGEVPAGALSRHAFADDAGTRGWLRADPVHLRPDLGKLVVFPPAALSLTLDEASRIAQWLVAQEHYPGPAVEALTATCWTASVDPLPRLVTTSSSEAHGRDAQSCLPCGADASAWHARMNVIQMLLHECPVNGAREAAGQPPVNSLWFWGAGTLATAPAAEGFAAAWGDDPVLRGAARAAGIAHAALPAEPARWCGSLAAGRHLLALDALEFTTRAGDPGAWRDALAALGREWLSPLASAVGRRSIARLEVHAGRGAGVVVGRGARRAWWRRRAAPAVALAALREAGGA